MKLFTIPGLVAITLSALLVGCDRLETNETPDPGANSGDGVRIEKVRVNLEQDPAATKMDVTMAGKASWTSGDQIVYCIKQGDNYSYSSPVTVNVSESTIPMAYADGQVRAGFAVYPAGVQGADAANLSVTYPDSYDLSGQNPETYAPCPMVAVNEPGEVLNFKHVGAVLRLQIAGLPAIASNGSVVVNFGDKEVTGNFAVTAGGTANATLTPDNGTHGSTVTFSGLSVTRGKSLYLNIPVPSGDYSDLELTVTCKEGSATVATMTKSYDWKYFERGRGRTAGVAPHVFSVGPHKQVIFAWGNLQATTADLGVNWSWAFAENQYDYIGDASANKTVNGVGTVSANGTMDLFGWNGASSSNNCYGINNSTTNTDYGSSATDALKADWGAIPSVVSKYGAGWRTPSKDEWSYLFNTRTTTSGIRYAKATVNSVAGMILLPDDWSTSYYTLASTNTASADYTANTISLSDWTSKLEAHGAVFLPAAGYRSGTGIYYVGSDGLYWSSTADSTTRAYNLNFGSSGVSPQDYGNRRGGFSVRLTHDI
ncbi:MAG: hypothetical protein K6A62_00995 [Bacteroidales bacterium]|nr:hypothetical protein [Bacteroidales bacterium]